MRPGVSVIFLFAAAGVASGQAPGRTSLRELNAAWKTMRRAEADSPAFAAAGATLKVMIGSLPASRRAAAATVLMDRHADDNINAAALRLFGKDPLPLPDVRKMLADPNRSFPQRVLLRTYFSFCRVEYRDSMLHKRTRLQLAGMLAERLEGLVKLNTKSHYGEYRLLVHLCQAVLSRYSHDTGAAGEADVKRLLAAMRDYSLAAGPDDPLASALRGWLALRKRTGGRVDSVDSALAALGHWEPLVRWRASVYLARHIAADKDETEEKDEKAEKVFTLVWAKLAEVHDEVRAAAARVFALSPTAGGDRVVGRMVEILTHDRGVVVQAAAAEVLLGRAARAGGAIEPLLAAFKRRRPGPKRAGAMLSVLAGLAGQGSEAQTHRMLTLAIENLFTSPGGSLELLKALGPAAAAAEQSVRVYRSLADRFHRHYIDRHVLPAICPSTPGK